YDFGADELLDAEGGWRAFGTLGMIVSRTGSDEGGRVIGLSDPEQRMLGAAHEDRAHQQGLDPGQDGLEKGAQQPKRERGQGGQVRERYLVGAWYTAQHNRLL